MLASFVCLLLDGGSVPVRATATERCARGSHTYKARRIELDQGKTLSNVRDKEEGKGSKDSQRGAPTERHTHTRTQATRVRGRGVSSLT